MNVLFVCTENVARSRVAEKRFRELQGPTARHAVRSVGTAPHAARRLTTRDLAWADVVGVMEPGHRDVVRKYWPHHAGKVVVLGVADLFLPDEVELREALESKLRILLDRCDALQRNHSRAASG
jgi:protein-tyrosine-phosphatase